VRRAAALAVLAVAGLAGCGGGDEESEPTTTETPPAQTSSTAGCEQAEAPQPREGDATAPTKPLDAAKTYRLAFETNCGSFTVTLDQKKAPKTTTSLVALARDSYFDDTIFHRIVPGFVIQGGDPTQSGSGGPGYSTVDKPPANTVYTKGLVAMAKTAAEAPGTSGSQFFVVTAEDAQLPPDYAVVGEVSAGLDVVERIGKLGDATQHPTQTVLIEKVTVSES
jgi:peptidyl-prolyl cis-trans isomerase B (cyclophilin B)